jgi:hypothetical protein
VTAGGERECKRIKSTSASAFGMQKRTAFLSGLVLLVLLLCFAVPWGRQDLMFQLLEGIESLSSCGSCLALLLPLQALARMGDDALVEALISLCSGLGVSCLLPARPT